METTIETTETYSFFLSSIKLKKDLKTVGAMAVVTISTKQLKALKLRSGDVIRFPNKTWWQITLIKDLGQFTDLKANLVRYPGKTFKMDSDFSFVKKVGWFRLWFYRNVLGLEIEYF